MKIPAHVSVACCTALLLAACPAVARSASGKVTLPDLEPQYASHLCWAAVDVAATNYFYPQCPLPAGTLAPNYFPTSQAVDAGHHAFDVQGSSVTVSLSQSLLDCESNIQAVKCNDYGFPPLRGLTSTQGFPPGTPPATGTNSTGLTWEAAKQEIDAGRPFLFLWGFDDGDSPIGLHQLLATGYSDATGTQRLQIWDPLPVPRKLVVAVPACGPAPEVVVSSTHSRWIDFSTYVTPVSDMGVTVVAEHDKDRWKLAKVVPEAPVLTVESVKRSLPPSDLQVSGPAAAPLAQVSFAQALGPALRASRLIDLQVPGAATRSLGTPFPIVGLTLPQLVAGRANPTGLLSGSTSAILFPVVSQGEVVDAFLMLFIHGRWQRAGYANLEITQRLVEVRATYAAKNQLPVDSFYMVSVPGEVAFFAAHGTGQHAILIPASTDPLIGAVAGQAAPAGQQLSKLILAAERDLKRHPAYGRDPTRPGH